MRLFQRLTRALKTEAQDGRAVRVRPLPSQPVEVQIIGKASLDVLRARDISESGVGVWVEHRFEGCDIKLPVELVITLPKRKPFLAKGVIKHVTRRDEPVEYFGVEFTEISEGNRGQIASYVGRTRT